MTIHVATVHWRTDRWINLQLQAIGEYVPQPHLVYAFLNDIPHDHRSRFFYASTEPIVEHATKLNLLGDMACLNAGSDDDVLMFIDGDAFPVGPIERLVSDGLRTHRLIAVERYENNGDTQPHPSFCLTTVGLWRELRGDWQPGHAWYDLSGNEVSDVGGNLLRLLEAAEVNWLRLRRLNRLNPHPLFFGVYGDERGPVVYHQGAGFRDAVSRVDLARLEALVDPPAHAQRETVIQNNRLSEEWFERLSLDAKAWRVLVDPGLA